MSQEKDGDVYKAQRRMNMAKIDPNSITGFDGMSAEEKVAALLGMDIPEQVDMSQFVSKAVADKYASDAADWKKKHNALLSEEEKKKQADTQAMEDMKKELEDLRRERQVSSYKASYLAQGYDEKLAEATAKALVDGDMETVFRNGATYKAELEKKIKADVLKNTPKPEGAGVGERSLTKQQFDAMGYSARVSLKAENPELYNKMMNGGNS